MKFFSPGALWFLSLIPLLILMYILKQRYEEKQISSLYLWQQVIMDLDATSPFQRLKRNILLFLQLLILLLCIFALANPFVWWKNNNYQNMVIVVDASGSMSSKGEAGTKLEEAKKEAEAMINSLSSGTKFTLISSAKNVKVQINGSSNKKDVINKLNAIKPTNSAGNIDDAYSLVKAICEQFESYRVVYFTDNSVDLKGLNGEAVIMGPQRHNLSLDYIAESKVSDGLKVMVRVTNHGNENTDAEVCLYGEDKLISIKNQNIAGGETKTIYFDKVPLATRYLYGELSNEDGLLEDNRIYSVVKQMDAKRVLLSADKNVFLEKALNTLKDIELFKTLPEEKINEEFDLYIYDGQIKGDIPKKGSLLLINPLQDNSLFKVGQEIVGGKAEVETHPSTKYMNNCDFVVSNIRDIDLPYWANPLLKIGDNTAAFSGELKGQKIAVVGFDLHNSDFPLTPEFPIFINNMISYLIDRDTMTGTKYSCGESIDIIPLPEAEKLTIESPDNNKVELSSKYPIKPYEDTYLPGIYTVSQRVGEEQVGKLIAVNFPISESNVSSLINSGSSDSESMDNAAAASNGNNRGGINLFNTLLLLALLVLAIEWVAYVRQ